MNENESSGGKWRVENENESLEEKKKVEIWYEPLESSRMWIGLRLSAL